MDSTNSLRISCLPKEYFKHEKDIWNQQKQTKSLEGTFTWKGQVLEAAALVNTPTSMFSGPNSLVKILSDSGPLFPHLWYENNIHLKPL